MPSTNSRYVCFKVSTRHHLAFLRFPKILISLLNPQNLLTIDKESYV